MRYITFSGSEPTKRKQQKQHPNGSSQLPDKKAIQCKIAFNYIDISKAVKVVEDGIYKNWSIQRKLCDMTKIQ